MGREGIGDSFQSEGFQPEQVPAAVRKIWAEIDTDRNGKITRSEVDHAVVNPKFTGTDAAVVVLLKTDFSQLSNFAYKNPLQESGITLGDVNEMEKRLNAKTEQNPPFLTDSSYFVGVACKLPAMRFRSHTEQTVPLSTKDIKSANVIQCGVGNCYLSASIIALAENNGQTIMDMMKQKGDGHVAVKLPGYNKEIDLGPLTQAEKMLYGKNRYGRENYRGIWSLYIEKAYGKMRQDKSQLKSREYASEDLLSITGGGKSQNALKMLTNRDVEEIDLQKGNKQSELIPLLKNRMQEAQLKHYPMVAYTEGDAVQQRPDGILTCHEYAVLNYNSVTGKVKVREPQAKVEPMAGDDAADGKKDGVFELSLNDFAKKFYGLNIANGRSKLSIDHKNAIQFEKNITKWIGKTGIDLTPVFAETNIE